MNSDMRESNADSYGGVLLRQNQQILMRESSGHQGGYVWTFAKSHPKPAEAPTDTALRAVKERLGWRAMILGVIDSVFAGTSSTTRFFVMGPVGKQGKVGARTAATRWVNLDEAEALIRQSWHPVAQARDLAVIAALRDWLARSAWADRPPACAEDWRIKPLPKQRRKLLLDRVFDSTAAARIAKGFIPAAMEQKWFAWFDGTVLHLHRSWTGICIYHVSFATAGRDLRAVCAWVNRNPDQYSETNDAADGRALINLMDDLFVDVPDTPPVDAFAEALSALAEPNYLGSPVVVRALLQPILAAAVDYVAGARNFTEAWQNIERTAQDIAGGDRYRHLSQWHTAAGLGVALCHAFGLRRDPNFADSLQLAVSEALCALFLTVRDMVKAFEADPAASWDSDAVPQLAALQEWAVTVFLGSHELLHPGVTLANFFWQAVCRDV